MGERGSLGGEVAAAELVDGLSDGEGDLVDAAVDDDDDDDQGLGLRQRRASSRRSSKRSSMRSSKRRSTVSSSRRKAASSSLLAEDQEPEQEVFDEDNDESLEEEEEQDEGVDDEDVLGNDVQLEDGDESAPAEVLEAGRKLKSAFAVFLVTWLVFDLLVMGLSAGSTKFVDIWDAIGTASYVRGRRDQYHLRHRENQASALWASYIVFNSFLLYDVAGKTVRSIMRHTLLLPTLKGFMEYMVMGFLPVHFSPKDRLFDFVEHDDIQQVIVCLFWAATKSRSIQGQILEAVTVHHWGFLPCFLIGVLSCEAASMISRAEQNLTRLPLVEVAQRFPDGVLTHVTSRTFQSSIFISLFTFSWIATRNVPLVGFVFSMLTFMACFYRYGNGLIERSLKTYLNIDVSNAVTAVIPRPSLAKDSLHPKNVRETLKELEARVQGLLDNFQPEAVRDVVLDKLEDFPAAALREKLEVAPAGALDKAADLYGATWVVLEQLDEDTREDLENLRNRVLEIAQDIDAGGKELRHDLVEASEALSDMMPRLHLKKKKKKK